MDISISGVSNILFFPATNYASSSISYLLYYRNPEGTVENHVFLFVFDNMFRKIVVDKCSFLVCPPFENISCPVLSLALLFGYYFVSIS